MKVKVELGAHEHVEDAEEFLTKAMSAKQECSGGERYEDVWLNQFEALVSSEHRKVLDQIQREILEEIELHAHRS